MLTKIPTTKQDKGIKDTLNWYRNKLKPVWSIGGFAGTGKSELIKFIMDGLDLSFDNIALLAYTGAASVVLIRKGLPGQTIHKFAYNPKEVKDEKTKKKKLIFTLKEKVDENIKLIIIDEASMVSDEAIEELLTFDIPIIVVGDPFQLKPVYGKMNKYIQHPDVFLDEPIRQALDNPIVWFATEIRNYRMPAYGAHGDTLYMYNKNDFPINLLTKADQIITGRNQTCDNLNNVYRKNFLNINKRLPVVGDKLMCLQNDWSQLCRDEKSGETYLVNGLLGYVNKITYNNDNKTFKMNFSPSYMETGEFFNVFGDTMFFYDQLVKNDRDYVNKTYPKLSINRISLYAKDIKPNYFNYGYCITVYKSQGFETDNVLYFDEFLRKDSYWNHFYTAVTRAKKTLNIVK